jgi:hypothetical protein
MHTRRELLAEEIFKVIEIQLENTVVVENEISRNKSI